MDIVKDDVKASWKEYRGRRKRNLKEKMTM